jgi:hypothetical protein
MADTLGPKETERDLYSKITEAQSKYIYFKIAAALSAIAFTVHVTQDDQLTATHAAFGLAVLLWAVSAGFGLKSVNNGTSIMTLNLEAMAAHRGTSAILSRADQKLLEQHPYEMKEDVLRQRVEELNIQTRRLVGDQWWLLLWGGIAFLVGHVLQMAGY